MFNMARKSVGVGIRPCYAYIFVDIDTVVGFRFATVRVYGPDTPLAKGGVTSGQ